MNSRKTRRFGTSLNGRLFGHDRDEQAAPLKASIISFGAGGCAIRTALRLSEGERLTLEIPLQLQTTSKDATRNSLRVPSEIVWGRPDYRIDTSYLYGVRFLVPLTEVELSSALSEEALLDDISGSSHSPDHNKVVA